MSAHHIFMTVVLACSLSLIVKNSIRRSKGEKSSFFEDGGMPSVHSAIMSSLTTAIYIAEGITTPFVVSLVISLLVIHDSFHLRHHVGRNSRAIDKIHEEHGGTEYNGHSFNEVCWGVLFGIVIAILYSVVFF